MSATDPAELSSSCPHTKANLPGRTFLEEVSCYVIRYILALYPMTRCFFRATTERLLMYLHYRYGNQVRMGWSVVGGRIETFEHIRVSDFCVPNSKGNREVNWIAAS